MSQLSADKANCIVRLSVSILNCCRVLLTFIETCSQWLLQASSSESTLQLASKVKNLITRGINVQNTWATWFSLLRGASVGNIPNEMKIKRGALFFWIFLGFRCLSVNFQQMVKACSFTFEMLLMPGFGSHTETSISSKSCRLGFQLLPPGIVRLKDCRFFKRKSELARCEFEWI